MTNLSTLCYTVQDGAVVEGTLADFGFYIKRTTRPHGVDCEYYPTTIQRRVAAVEDDDGHEIEPERVEDVWVLAKWATWGGPQVVVREFDSEAEAIAAAEETYVYDILNKSETPIHLDRAGAEEELRQLIEDAE